jgi:hypothetical protein
MNSIKEGEGTSLRKSTILFGARMRDGNSHIHTFAVALVGTAGETIASGRHLVLRKAHTFV